MRFRYKLAPESHPRDDFFDMFTWCQQLFGDPGLKNSAWTYKHGTWHFRRREDYVMFTLRWI